MSKNDRVQSGILGDINPTEGAKDHLGGPSGVREDDTAQRHEEKGTITSGTEVGGTRNYHQGSGAVGGDIGNRPE